MSVYTKVFIIGTGLLRRYMQQGQVFSCCCLRFGTHHFEIMTSSVRWNL